MKDVGAGMLTRRSWLLHIGARAGAGMMLQAMGALALATPSGFQAPQRLQGAPRGARVLVLGAGMAGLVAAHELRAAGYQVQVLEYNQRAGGRSWTLRPGDVHTELGGVTQQCRWAPGQYFNPGPWRIPHHHHALLHYAQLFKVPLEPFVQVNHNAYLHARGAFGGQPLRYREVMADFHGELAELLDRLAPAAALDQPLDGIDRERLRAALRAWGALDGEGRYRINPGRGDRRGWAVPPGGGRMSVEQPSAALPADALWQSGLWEYLADDQSIEHQTTLLQPVGGMDRIAQALHASLKPLVRLGTRVQAVQQDERGVRAVWTDTRTGTTHTSTADACVCTLPLSILGQLDVQVQPAMRAAIEAVPYASAVKVGLQFKRRFWEQDEAIYGGISHTDMAIGQIGYPSHGLGAPGPGVLLGAYVWGPNAFTMTGMSPAQRVEVALAQGSVLHPAYRQEFDVGMSVAWHRVPFTLGCFGQWSNDARARHYEALTAVDGRLVLAGEHASRLPAWQEGAVLSALDATSRLHAHLRATMKGVA
ncbi:MAG: flavin monoamine oxidase [Burkholderiales bacterium PBB6]|nr:MAG: flavin monoamine oxidase [Burkholderiales bacterium PBB6]